ncbi:hypothetical protein AT959_05145 [Dechloromonas denitrificans]|uniref:Uncharacterized protein n=1 Tax=Dechloromonas denitrificans TaxID=281362 RepID=A0A133XLE1_9RHOO|nr:hypothetical protein [Dechloromonas denitrificans]KXB31741.1 hypothetical protein AT959_05145 [Dechloromonas denitrificans]
MSRKTLREISRLFNVEKTNTPGAVAVLKINALPGDKGLRFVGTVQVGAVVYDVASDSGKIKTFSDVDSYLKFAAKAAEKGNGVYTVEINTGELLASTVPNDMKSWAESQIVRLNKSKVSQQALIVSIDEQLGLMVGWENGNSAQQAKKLETQAQRACVVTDIAAIDTEVARLAVIAAG